MRERRRFHGEELVQFAVLSLFISSAIYLEHHLRLQHLLHRQLFSKFFGTKPLRIFFTGSTLIIRVEKKGGGDNCCNLFCHKDKGATASNTRINFLGHVLNSLHRHGAKNAFILGSVALQL